MEKIISNSREEMVKIINLIIEQTKKEYENNEFYKIDGNINQTVNFNNIFELGCCDFKRLKRYVNKCLRTDVNRIKYLTSVNKLFHFLSKKSQFIRVHISDPKHKEIQIKRKAWKKALMESDKLLQEYKEFKSDYYKRKFGLIKN